jgi:hypothetical protein
MRRIVSLVGLLCLVLAPLGAGAQSTFPVPGVGGIIAEQRGTVTVFNSTTATSLFNVSLPSAYAALPLHLKLVGSITTNGAGTGVTGIQSTGPVLLTMNYGGSTASVTIMNTAALNWGYASAPVQIDIFMRPRGATDTLTQFVAGTFSVASAAATPTQLFGGTVQGSTNPLTGPKNFTVNWQWASGSAGNGIRIESGLLMIGN